MIDRRICVAPMMAYTDRHCRYVHRLFAPTAVLYTEMIVAAALVRGDARRLLAFHETEHPVALQLGGSEPLELAAAARIGADAGYDEINLNVGCPSGRVQNAEFGACLMAQPERVAACVARMMDAVGQPVTVKCRIGLGGEFNYAFFRNFVETVAAAGVRTFIVHARNALLDGVSPKQNREIPPLNYEFVYRLKLERPDLCVVLNGGIRHVEQAREALRRGVDGVMVGRAAVDRPAILSELEQALIDPEWRIPKPEEIIELLIEYAEVEGAAGVKLHCIARHLHGLFAGTPGARAWRRFLSEHATSEFAQPSLLRRGPTARRAVAA